MGSSIGVGIQTATTTTGQQPGGSTMVPLTGLTPVQVHAAAQRLAQAGLATVTTITQPSKGNHNTTH